MDAIQPGASFAQVIDKINEIVQYVNTKELTPISYSDLSDKPRIDSIELTENTEMKDLRIDLLQLPDISQLEELITNVASSMAAQVAETVATEKVQSELSIEEARKTGYEPQDDMEIFIFKTNELGQKVKYYLSLSDVAEYTMNYINTKNDIVVGIPG